MPESRKLRVFLCHASQDKPVVRELYQKLLAEGFDPWLDEEKLLPGQDWDLEIEKAVEFADAVIVCLSDKSVTKEGYVQKEIRFVLEISDEKPEQTIFILPLRLSDCSIPRRLKKWQYVDYFEDQGKAFARLCQSLQLRGTSLGLAFKRPSSEFEGVLNNLGFEAVVIPSKKLMVDSAISKQNSTVKNRFVEKDQDSIDNQTATKSTKRVLSTLFVFYLLFLSLLICFVSWFVWMYGDQVIKSLGF